MKVQLIERIKSLPSVLCALMSVVLFSNYLDVVWGGDTLLASMNTGRHLDNMTDVCAKPELIPNCLNFGLDLVTYVCNKTNFYTNGEWKTITGVKNTTCYGTGNDSTCHVEISTNNSAFHGAIDCKNDFARNWTGQARCVCKFYETVS